MLPNNMLVAGSGLGNLVNLPLVADLSGRVNGGVNFSRASGQWYQDDAGVWQYVGNNIPAINSKGILLEPASTNKCTCYGTIPADLLGVEKAINGGFDTDTTWGKGTGWSISGGVAIATSAAGNSTLTEAASAVLGRVYQITFTVVSITAGGFAARCGDTVGTARNAPGTYTETLLCAGSGTNIGVQTIGTTNGSLDNVSIKEVQYAIGTKSFYNGAWVQNHTNLTVTGDTAAVLSTVDDMTSIMAAGLMNICPSGKVYKLDNSAGGGWSAAMTGGLDGNTNTHCRSAFVRGGSHGIGQNNAAVTSFSGSGSYVRESDIRSTSGVSNLFIVANPGQVVYFLAPQLEELPYCTSPMPSQGATATRAGCLCSFATAGNVPSDGVTIYLEATPLSFAGPGTSNGYTPMLLDAEDANNMMGLSVDTTAASPAMYARNKGGGVVSMASAQAISFVAGTTYKMAGRWSNGAAVFISGTKGNIVGTRQTITLPASMYIGYRQSANQYTSPIHIRNLRIYRRALSDAQCIAMTQ